ncbi:MAG: SPOR domain-containing protein [Pseudomonadota bacterium]
MKERLIGAVVLVSVAWLLIPVFLENAPNPDETVSRSIQLPGVEGAQTQVGKRVTIDLRENRPASASAGEQVQQPATLPPPDAPVQALPSDTATVQAAATEDASDAARKVGVENEGEGATTDPSPPVEQALMRDSETPLRAASDVEAQPQPLSEPVSESPSEASVEPAPAQPVAPAPEGGVSLWVVQLGSFSNADNAQRLADRYKAQGLPAFMSRVERDGRSFHRVRIGPVATRTEADEIVLQLTQAGQTARTVAYP